ncbi:MAG: hypothetical protein CSYNP_02847 [Syntrophus sp. SKADARSKE-3]|nr:hypothetical protein [Syntrophus sp. SKADARSKE-3]
MALKYFYDMTTAKHAKYRIMRPTSLYVAMENLVRTPDGLDRRFYELCVLSNCGTRYAQRYMGNFSRFRDFEEYLPPPHFTAQRNQQKLQSRIETDGDRFLEAGWQSWNGTLATVEMVAADKRLISITRQGKDYALDTPPDEAEALMQRAYVAHCRT